MKDNIINKSTGVKTEYICQFCSSPDSGRQTNRLWKYVYNRVKVHYDIKVGGFVDDVPAATETVTYYSCGTCGYRYSTEDIKTLKTEEF